MKLKLYLTLMVDTHKPDMVMQLFFDSSIHSLAHSSFTCWFRRMAIGFCFIFVFARVAVSQKANEKSQQTRMLVETATANGTGPFFPSRAIVLGPNVAPENYVVPRKFKTGQIRFFNLQPDQAFFERHLAGEITRERYEGALPRLGIDTAFLTRQHVEQKLAIYYGIDSLKNYVIILDRNFNKSFLDDSVQHYRYIGDADGEAEEHKSLVPQKIKHEYYDGRSITKVTSSIVIDPYRGHLNLGKQSYLDSLLYLSVGFSDYKEAKFLFYKKRYKVAVSNGFGGRSYNNKNRLAFIFAKEDTLYHTQASGNVPYRLGDIVTLDGYQLRIDSIHRSGSPLYFTDLGYQRFPEGHLVGLYVPQISATTVDYRMFSFRDYRGKYLVLDFWGTWCGPCIEALPKLKALIAQYEKKNIQFVGVAFDDTPDRVKKFAEQKEMHWPQVFQDKQNPLSADLVNKLKITAYPTVILVDPDGKIIMRETLLEPIEKKLAQLLGK